MEGFCSAHIPVWCWEQGVYGPGEGGLLILGRLAAKASFSLLNFGPPILFPSSRNPTTGSGGKPAFRTTGPLEGSAWEVAGLGRDSRERRQLTRRAESFSEPLGLTSGDPFKAVRVALRALQGIP